MDDFYYPGQVEAVLNEIGIEIVGETDTNFLCLCIFHNNTDTPALSVEKDRGIYLCFAPHCDTRGTLSQLVKRVTKSNTFTVRRIIEKHKVYNQEALQKTVEDLFDRRDELPSFSQDTLDRMYESFWSSPGQTYMNGRGFTDKTLAYFGIGYSSINDMVAIPVHDWEGNPVGIVGRSIEGKRFKNSKNLPTRKTLFNIHRAKTIGETCIIVESATDAMIMHQSGFPHTVATNGGFFTSDHAQLINRYFNNVIIMTDFDNPQDHKSLTCNKCENTCLGHIPGRALGEKIVKALPGKRVRWAAFDYGIIFPHDAKDPGQMTEEERIQCIENAVNTAEYELWKKDFPLLAMI